MEKDEKSLKEENERLRKIVELYEEIIKYQEFLLSEERGKTEGRIIL